MKVNAKQVLSISFIVIIIFFLELSRKIPQLIQFLILPQAIHLFISNQKRIIQFLKTGRAGTRFS